MKRFVIIILTLLMCLCGCGEKTADSGDALSREESGMTMEPDSEEYETICNAVDGFNNTDRRSTVVRLSVGEGDTTLFFTEGTYSYDRAHPVVMSGKTTQLINGTADTMDVYYKAGAYYRDSKTGKYYASMEKDGFLQQHLCVNLPICDVVGATKVIVSETAVGTKYDFDYVDVDFCDLVFDESFQLYSGLHSYVEEKTVYENGCFSYVIGDDGSLKSFSLSCQAVLYDTPGYYPTGYTPTEDELKKVLDIRYEVSVKDLGDAVEIKSPNTDDYYFLG